MTARPSFMARNPSEQPATDDVLSDVLRAVRLTGAVFFTIDGTAPWGVEGYPATAVGPLIRPGVEHVLQFHAVARGACWIGLIGEPPVQLHAGDILILPHGDRHALCSAPGVPAGPPEVRLDGTAPCPLPLPVRLGAGNGARCQLVCGFLGCEARPFNPLLSAVPQRMLVVRGGQGDPALARLIEMALAESANPSAGREVVLARLAELIFVEAMRRHVAAAPDQAGWLSGIADATVGRALSALHARPRQAWTLESLAREVGASRSVLADRFAALVGAPPMQYLARWRMQLTSELLSGTGASLAEIAGRVGYGSEAAL
ncbi:MAG TPA: AraC family transcriptional regulator, partial [Myxococcaceae bacterium]|nr:AraC family transcriptional regulator [Myxococcaceae bacterium]